MMKPFLFILLVIYAIIFLAQPINLTTADLGRHLKNGQLFFENGLIPATNLYSYTYPHYPFTNHHWGFGVVSYLIFKLTGFVGVSIFFIAAGLVTFYLFFDVARKSSNFYIATILSLLIMPIGGSRTEIRPEVFSYLFAAVFFWVLWHYQQTNQLRPKPLILLPLTELLWVNLHIYFPLGLVITGIFLIQNVFGWLVQKDKLSFAKMKQISGILLICSLITLVNPNTIKGVLYPLNIFKEYGYRLFENQSVLFIEKIIPYPAGMYFKIAFVLLVASWIYKIIACHKQKDKISASNLVLSIFFSVLAWKAVRNFTIFGYFALPIISTNLSPLKSKLSILFQNSFNFTVSFILVLFLIFLINPSYWKNKNTIGFGLSDGVEKSAQFFLSEEIKGPIFNNYDIGGYLIYYLYPKDRVFVDNRPETYPVSFFQDEYIPMQENEAKWSQALEKYQFNAIFFYRQDITPWAQNFLINRIKDDQWASVFVDNFSIIFLRKNDVNEEVIKKYELPKNIFKYE